jgi:hypothetical protein
MISEENKTAPGAAPHQTTRIAPLLSLRLNSLNKTFGLAHMLDSLVRVSRRVGWMTDLLALDFQCRLQSA